MSFIHVTVSGGNFVTTHDSVTTRVGEDWRTTENRLEKLMPVDWARHNNMPFKVFESRESKIHETIQTYGGFSETQFSQIVCPYPDNRHTTTKNWEGAYALSRDITTQSKKKVEDKWIQSSKKVERYVGLVRLGAFNPLFFKGCPDVYSFNSNVFPLRVEVFDGQYSNEMFSSAIELATNVIGYFERSSWGGKKIAYLFDVEHARNADIKKVIEGRGFISTEKFTVASDFGSTKVMAVYEKLLKSR